MEASNPGNTKSQLGQKIYPYLSIITFLVVWEAAVKFQIVPSTLLASPTEVFKLFIEKFHVLDPDGALWYTHALVSIEEAFTGYILALVIGLPIGLAMGWFPVVEGIVRPIFEAIKPIPSIAWIPLTVYWFGIGLASKIFIITVAGIIPCVINAYYGVKMTNPVFINMARTYGASDWQIFKTICIPSSLPMVFGALQIALASCWVTLVAAELVAANVGLGYLITVGRMVARPDVVILGMISVGFTGAIIGYIIDRVERRLLAGIRR